MKNRMSRVLLPAVFFVSLVTASSPSLTGMLRAVKVSSASHGFMSDLHLAHSEAARRNSRVALCKSRDGVFCAASGDWAQGWIVFQDDNGNGVREAGEPLVLREQRFAGTLRVSGSLNAARTVSFTPAGRPQLWGTSLQAGTLTVCYESNAANEARRVTITPDGAMHAQKELLERCA